jgi:hypothetical protein
MQLMCRRDVESTKRQKRVVRSIQLEFRPWIDLIRKYSQLLL